MRISREDKFTIREIKGTSEVKQDAWQAIFDGAEIAFSKLGIDEHLFITVVGAEMLIMGRDPSDRGVAVYHSGVRHIAVCGGDGPREFKNNREGWLQELKLSIVHEIVHYWQDLNGTLVGTEENEDQTEAKSREILSLPPLEFTRKQEAANAAKKLKFRERLAAKLKRKR